MSRIGSKIGTRLGSRLSLPLLFSFAVFLIFLVTVIVTGLLFYLADVFGLINEKIIMDGTLVPLLILISCIIIGTAISAVSSRKMVKSIRTFIDATDRLAGGDFSMRLQLTSPPEFRILSENFNRMAEELGGIEILRTDFVNNFSHEFKTPIVSIKGFAEMLKYDDLSRQERDEYLDIVIEESARLASLASNVLELSKIETQTILTDKKASTPGSSSASVCCCLRQSSRKSSLP